MRCCAQPAADAGGPGFLFLLRALGVIFEGDGVSGVGAALVLHFDGLSLATSAMGVTALGLNLGGFAFAKVESLYEEDGACEHLFV